MTDANIGARQPGTPHKPADGVVGAGQVRAGAYMAVPDLLRERGVDPAPLLAEFGLSPAHFADPDVTLPFADMGRLLRRCAEAANCPGFSLLVGRRATFSSLGPVGFLMQSSPDIRGALGNLSRHYRVHNPNARISASEDEGFAAFGVGVLGAVADYDQLVDLALAAALNIMQAMCGDEWHPTEVRFAHACPEDLAPYRFFGSPMHFDQRESALIFPAYWLDRAPRGADRLLNRMMAHTVSGIEASAVEDLVARVHRMLPAMVFDGKASLAAVAIHLGLGTRTLNRRLAEGGSSFAELRERACHAIARQFLEGTTMAAGEIAALLGYAHSSAFTRAFRRWSGMSPVQWRAAHHRRTGRPDTAKASDAATPVDRHQAGAPSTDSGGS